MRVITKRVKPGLHQPQLQVEWSVILLNAIVVERRRFALKSAASFDYGRVQPGLHEPQLQVEWSVKLKPGLQV